MDPTAEIEHAVAELEPGGQLVGVRELSGGVSTDVFCLDIATASDRRRRVVFRRHRSDHFKGHDPRVTAKEFGLLAALHRRGLAVPEPYLCHHDAIGPYMIIEWIDGSTDVAPGDLPTALDEMARFLVDLHVLDPISLQVPQLEQIEDPRRAIALHLPATDAGERVRAALTAGALERDQNRPVVLHGDYWPGNVLWRTRTLLAVIDWEDACLGDPLADLATARVELLCRYGSDAMEHFTTRYLAMMEDTATPLRLDALLVWELYVSASALSTMGGWGLEPAEEARRRRLTEDFFQRAAGKVG